MRGLIQRLRSREIVAVALFVVVLSPAQPRVRVRQLRLVCFVHLLQLLAACEPGVRRKRVGVLQARFGVAVLAQRCIALVPQVLGDRQGLAQGTLAIDQQRFDHGPDLRQLRGDRSQGLPCRCGALRRAAMPVPDGVGPAPQRRRKRNGRGDGVGTAEERFDRSRGTFRWFGPCERLLPRDAFGRGLPVVQQLPGRSRTTRRRPPPSRLRVRRRRTTAHRYLRCVASRRTSESTTSSHGRIITTLQGRMPADRRQSRQNSSNSVQRGSLRTNSSWAAYSSSMTRRASSRNVAGRSDARRQRCGRERVVPGRIEVVQDPLVELGDAPWFPVAAEVARDSRAARRAAVPRRAARHTRASAEVPARCMPMINKAVRANRFSARPVSDDRPVAAIILAGAARARPAPPPPAARPPDAARRRRKPPARAGKRRLLRSGSRLCSRLASTSDELSLRCSGSRHSGANSSPRNSHQLAEQRLGFVGDPVEIETEGAIATERAFGVPGVVGVRDPRLQSLLQRLRHRADACRIPRATSRPRPGAAGCG